MSQTILVTGGTGYIGSHTVIELLEAHFHVVILDNFCNSSPKVIKRIKTIVKATLGDNIPLTLIEGDIRDKELLSLTFTNHPITSVIHFAGLKAVGESVNSPLEYYNNNLYGTLCLCEVIRTHFSRHPLGS